MDKGQELDAEQRDKDSGKQILYSLQIILEAVLLSFNDDRSSIVSFICLSTDKQHEFLYVILAIILAGLLELYRYLLNDDYTFE